MLIAIPSVLASAEALDLGWHLQSAAWVDGNVTSGSGAALAKKNRQLPQGSTAAEGARMVIQKALAQNELFLSAALPSKIYPLMFNRYGPGDKFGDHVDNAIRIDTGSGAQMRTDISATLFLSDPGAYDGGELTVVGPFGKVAYKLSAGDMVLYPSTSLHRVTEITRGERLACFFWVESLVRDDSAREALFDLDQSIQKLTADRGGDDREVLRLTKVYHTLMRRWAR